MMKLRSFSDEKLFEILKDSCLKESIYWAELKFYPESEDLVTPAERDEMIAYLLEVCERSDMSLSIETFSLTVSLVDRFLTSYRVKSKYLECLAVSCLYIASKIKEEDEKISVASEFLSDCNSKCSVSELLRMELMILIKFEWSVDHITAADFLYIFHAILVNKYNNFSELNMKKITKNQWKVCITEEIVGKVDSAFPPSKLDFLHSLEYKLKQLLCSHELTGYFKSRDIALALLIIQVEKVFNQNEEAESNLINKAITILMQHSKITNANLKQCKEKIISHLETIDADNKLLDQYMGQYYSEMARNHRANSRLSVCLSSIAKHLAAIKEEDESDEQEKVESRVLSSISNHLNQNSMDTCTVPFNNMASNIYNADQKNQTTFSFQVDNHNLLNSNSSSYANILLGIRDQKRKLSENSIDEDYVYDCGDRN